MNKSNTLPTDYAKSADEGAKIATDWFGAKEDKTSHQASNRFRPIVLLYGGVVVALIAYLLWGLDNFASGPGRRVEASKQTATAQAAAVRAGIPTQAAASGNWILTATATTQPTQTQPPPRPTIERATDQPTTAPIIQASSPTPTRHPTTAATPAPAATNKDPRSILPTVAQPQPSNKDQVNSRIAPAPIDLGVWPGGNVWAVNQAFPATGEIVARISYYWPPYGGINCHGDCTKMASGQYWADWVGRAAACPAEYPFYTEIMINGHSWLCLDRGGAIKTENGIAWIDLLSPVMPYGMPFSTVVRIPYKTPAP